LLLVNFQYLRTEIFYKDSNNKFEGDSFYNPYKNFTKNTYRANFHAHSIAWKKVTNGHQTSTEVYNNYKSNGYDVASLSNYHHISIDSTESEYIPAYEHGYNIKKCHYLIIGADKVSYFDFSLFQSFHHKQQVIKKLSERDGLITVAHPKFNNAFSKEDMKFLKGYDFIEVFTLYRSSPEIWDAALSNGYPAWLMANDDYHDINKPGQFMVSWTRISSKEKNKEQLLEALKSGCFYGVRNEQHAEINELDSCIVNGNKISISFKLKADSIKFIGDNGIVRKAYSNQDTASYNILRDDSYIRVEAKTGEEIINLNPVIRYDGISLPDKNSLPEVNHLLTFLTRILFFISGIILLALILLINGKFQSSLRFIGSLFKKSR